MKEYFKNDLRYQFYGSVDDRGRRTWDTKAYEQKAKTGYAGRDGLRRDFHMNKILILLFNDQIRSSISKIEFE